MEKGMTYITDSKCALRLFVLTVMTVLLCQCSPNEYQAPEFGTVKEMELEILSEDVFNYGPANIELSGDYILISGYSGPTSETFYVFDKSGKLLKSGINHGRGPGETLVGYIRMSVYGDTVSYLDLTTKELLSFSLENFMSSDPLEVNTEFLDLPAWCTDAQRTSRGQMVRVISRSWKKDLDLPQRTVELEDWDGTIQKYEGQVFEDREISWNSNMAPFVAISPDGAKMAITPTLGMTVELFSLEGQFRRTGIKRFFAPDVEKVDGQLEYKDTYIYANGAVKATNTELYYAYDGETTRREMNATNDALLFKNLAVFDWEGNPKCLYKTKYRLHRFCIDESEKTVYAILGDKEGRFHLGKGYL